MRRAHILRAIALSILLLPLALPVGESRADTSQEQQSQKEGPLPEALEAVVRDRKELISREITGLSENEWAGVYGSTDALTEGTSFSWAPAAGFVVRWSTCSHGWRERVNYGGAIFRNGSLELTPELSGNGGNVYPITTNYIPVLWGEQHYLIRSDQLINFCYAVKNAGHFPEIDTFFIKEGDSEKRRKGLPTVPREYRKYLYSKPIIAAISVVEAKPEAWSRRLTLNVGRTQGVVSGMKFYAAYPRNVKMFVEVIEVGEHTSEAYVISMGYKSDSEKTVEPRVGWKLTSRAPENAYSYYPG